MCLNEDNNNLKNKLDLFVLLPLQYVAVTFFPFLFACSQKTDLIRKITNCFFCFFVENGVIGYN